MRGPHSGPLGIHGLADRAQVFVEGRLAGTLGRNDPAATVQLTLPLPQNRVDILVDAMGRVNFGPFLADRKGIDGWVAMSTEQKLFGWETRPLPLDDLSGPRFATTEPGPGPVFHHATATVATPEDGFLALPGWEKGVVWLNGFNLGRYWQIGPQQTLYAPKPLWRKGKNEIVVLELHRPGTEIEIRPEADLG
ncbi:hypothetical protein [Amycolatopsis sulphurea]|uniref:hypothetical protein n=1 Tax=Amycolatopsis sulphurea TaxID=76022 RepID=UPI001FE3862D|nr:hypothetical protein [Amycolatopsis sulphurea]